MDDEAPSAHLTRAIALMAEDVQVVGSGGIGTQHDDTLAESVESGTIYLAGGPGRDTFYGLNRTSNIVDYSDSATPIMVDMAGNTVIVGSYPDYREFDRLVDIVALRGSTGNDCMIGAHAYETFYGDAGNDLFAGGASYGGAEGGAFYDGSGISNLRFIARLSDLTFTFVTGRPTGSPGAIFISSMLDGTIQVQDVERIQTESVGRILGARAPGMTGVATIRYYVNSPDVDRAGLDAEAHYVRDGWREGRDPNASPRQAIFKPIQTSALRASIPWRTIFNTVGVKVATRTWPLPAKPILP